MNIHLVTGGARSGKSRHAERLAAGLTEAVTYIATAEAGDEEMRQRIALHRSRRPDGWLTVEAPRTAPEALRAATTHVVLLDCLTLLAANAFLYARISYDAAIGAVARETRALLDAAATRTGELIIVTNEIGFGVVPDHQLGRWFRDALGQANLEVAALADTVTLVVSGIPIELKTTR